MPASVTKVYVPKSLRDRGYVYTLEAKAELLAKIAMAKPNTMIPIQEVLPGHTTWTRGRELVLKASHIAAVEEVDEKEAY